MIQSLSIDRFVSLLVLTLMMMFFFLKRKNDFFVIAFTILYLFYAGLGWLNPNVKFDYIFYYLIYYIVFIAVFLYFRKILSVFFSLKKNLNPKKTYIYLYVFSIFLFSFFYDFSLAKYFRFRGPDLNFFSVTTVSSFYQQIFNYISLVLFPFYLYSLEFFIQKRKIFQVILFLVLPLYFLYSINSYISRTALLLNILLILVSYVRVYPASKKIFVVISIGSLPFIIEGLYNYTVIRSSGIIEKMSFSNLLDIFYIQEFSWPIYYNDIVNYSKNYLVEFFVWIVTLPIPSFLKGNNFEFSPNYIFSSIYTGVDYESEYFNVLLLGPVNESIFYVGEYFFFLLPCFAAIMFSTYIAYFNNLRYGKLIALYIFLFELPHFIRAGFSSVFPFLLNGFIFFFIVVFLSNIKTSK